MKICDALDLYENTGMNLNECGNVINELEKNGLCVVEKKDVNMFNTLKKLTNELSSLIEASKMAEDDFK